MIWNRRRIGCIILSNQNVCPENEMPRRVGTHEAKTHLSEYLNRVAYAGERVLVERHGKPLAALVSVGTDERE